MIFLIWIAVFFGMVAIYLNKVYSSFKNNGIKYETPIPLLGNMAKVVFRRNHIAFELLDLYNKYAEEWFVGRYEFLKELVIIRDLDLIKQMTVKDFEYFLDHRSIFTETNSYLSRNLISLQGQEWKDMRSTLSPAFTSSKIRVMVPFMVEVGDHMMAKLKKNIKESKSSRFALCELKVITYQILLHMEISPCDSTCIPAKFDTKPFNLRLQGGHNLRFRLRS